MKWKLIVRRPLSPLFFNFITQGKNKKFMKEKAGIDMWYDHYKVVEGAVYYDEDEINRADAYAKKMYDLHGAKFFVDLFKRWQGFVENLEKVTHDISKIEFHNPSNDTLLEQFEKLQESYKLLSTALYTVTIIEKLSNTVIKPKLPKDKVEEYFAILTTPRKENDGIKENLELYELAIKFKLGQDIKEDIKEHIEKWGWLTTRGFFGNPWNENDVMERIKSIKDPQKQYDSLSIHLKTIQEQTDNILDEINADNDFRNFIDVEKDYVYFRTERMDAFVRTGFRARNLFYAIADKLNIDLQEVFCLTAEEIKASLKTGNDYSALAKERRQGFALVLLGDEEIQMFSGEALKKFKEQEEKDEIDLFIKEIKGSMGCKGKVTGIVKVLHSKEDAEKVQEGDILVTSMTIPDYLPAMERAAAFVTNEGGITCHAAIIAREMNKPSVIGTIIATKVLKDGDRVEVDADNGVVRRL
tara:strand:- start:2505 stop:3914 length:1410 start_codon:yes stop_codon:yes gene_type:complete